MSIGLEPNRLAGIPPAPREVRLRPDLQKGSQERGLLFFILMPHTWIAVGALGWLLVVMATLLLGTVTLGKVTAHEVNRGAKKTTHTIQYEYTEGGQRFWDSVTVSDDAELALKAGDTLNVGSLHLGRRGMSYLVSPTRTWPKPGGFFILWATGWNLIWYLIFRQWYLLPQRKKRILQTGAVARGVVTGIKDIGGSMGQTREVAYAYEVHQSTEGYVSAERQEVRARMTVSRSLDRAMEVGEELTVFYSPERQARSVALELSNYEVAGVRPMESRHPAAEAPLPAVAQINAGHESRAPTLPPAPRVVRRRKGIPPFLALALFMLIPHVWLGLAMMGAAIGNVALSMFGRETQATVISTRSEHGKGMRYYVAYSYSESGNRYQGEGQVNEAASHKKPGDHLPVTSLHLMGLGSARLVGHESAGGSWFCMFVFGLIWNGMLWGVFLSWFNGVRRRRQLVVLGDVATGSVTAKRVTRGKGVTYHTEYSYDAGAGRSCCGTWSTSDAKEDKRLQVGDCVAVLYSKANPQWKSVLHGFSEYEAIKYDLGMMEA